MTKDKSDAPKGSTNTNKIKSGTTKGFISSAPPPKIQPTTSHPPKGKK